MTVTGFVLAALVAMAFVASVARAAPDVTVTGAMGGTGISLDTTASGTDSGAYTPLGDIEIAEGAMTDFASPQDATTLILSAPTGFEFQPATGTAAVSAGDVTVNSTAVATSEVTVTITVSGTATTDTLTISGLHVRPNNQTPSAGAIRRTDGSTSTIAGLDGTKDLGSLSSVPGALADFHIEARDGGSIGSQTAGQSFDLQFTARDQFGNTLTGVNDATPFAGSVQVSSNVDGSAGLGASATFSNGVLAAHAVTLTATSNNAATITVTNASPAIESTSAAFTVSPHFTSASPAQLGQGAATQDVTVLGTGFDATTAVTLSGAGITVHNTTRQSASELTANVSIDDAATPGTRDLTITNGDGTSVTASAGFTVNAAPTVTSLAPDSLAQGVSGQNLTVTGTGFVTGAVAAFTGTGVTVENTNVVSSTELSLGVSVTGDATTGTRDLTVTNPDMGSDTATALFTVNAAPAFTSATTDAAGSTITVSFTEHVADPSATQAQFSFKIDAGATRSFSQAQAGAADEVVLTVDGPAIASGDMVTLSYTAGTLEGTDGGVVQSFVDQAVTNAVPAPSGTGSPSDRSTVVADVEEGESVSLLPAGTSVSASQPLNVSVTTPTGGRVSIESDLSAEPTQQTGFSMLGVVVDIDAPVATSEAPLTIPFTLHPSLFDGKDALMLVPLRDGTAMSRCTGPAGVASPDPCVASRTVDADGNLVIRVLTSAASTWTLGEAESCPASTFDDVPRGATHTTAVDCALQFGIVHGFGDGSFGPREAVRRDQMASFIARGLEAAGHELPEAADRFTDVSGSKHADAIGRLAAAGIVNGTGTDTYDPADPVRRDQMASLLVGAAEWAGVDTTVPSATDFGDIENNTHEEAIGAAAALGLTVGLEDGIYGPAMTVRREQMATFLLRLHGLL